MPDDFVAMPNLSGGDILGHALALLDRGCSIFPVDHPAETKQTEAGRVGKAPLIPWKPLQSARSTEADVRQWFGNGHRRNVGLVTGAISGLVVVDCDSPEAVAWADVHLPSTPWRVRTGRGEHRGYRHPGVPVQNAVRLDTGDPNVKLDVRGDGGYVVAPGSVHATGAPYAWIGDPPASIDALPVFDPAWLGRISPDARMPEVSAPPSRISEGSRNQTIFHEGCRLRHGGLERDEILAALLAFNARRCDPPLDAAEVERIAASCATYPPAAIDFPLTNVGDAENFAALYDGQVAFDARRGRWLLREGESGLWLPDPVERLRELAVGAMRTRQRRANEVGDLEKRKQAWNWAVKGESTARLNDLLREARTQPAIRNDSERDPWDAVPHLLGVIGGVVDLRTGEKRKARPEERVTMCARADYDPSARSALWEKALRDISDDDDEWVRYLQRLGGYTITGDTSQDRWFIEHGKNGREGKGTKSGAWAAALGDYVLELPAAVFDMRPKGNPDFDLAYLPGKRFVLSSETGNTVHLNHDRIKKLTGGDTWRVANKHERSFEFVPSCKLWLACNDLPTVTDDSAAFWARVIVIPYRRSFIGKEDTTLRPTLSGDPVHRRAVLAWLVKGSIDYYRDGLGDMPRCIAEATSAFRDVSWPLTPFVTEDCITAPDARVSVGDFNLAYQQFCERQGMPADRRLGWKRILRLMEARYETVQADEMKRDGSRVREKRYVGIGLREPVVQQPSERIPDDEVPF